MKTISTFLILLMFAGLTGFAQTTYTVNTNSSYSANCNNCTFNIAPAVTLTINEAGTCNNCTFNGGNIEVKKTVTCQPCSFSGNKITMTDQSIKPNSNTTTFQNVVLTANGASSIAANTAVTITNSVFTFNGISFFNNNGGQLDMSNSTFNLFGNSYFNANAGPVNLKNASKIVAGNGLLGSLAYIKINGPALNIVDNASAVILSNLNNSYFNWSSFNSLSNGVAYATTYPSAASTLNCGAPGQNACGFWSAPTVYGPAGLNFAGVAKISSLLPVTLTHFTANSTDGYVALKWITSQEVNADYFSVERSANGYAWEKIATVAAKGNSAMTTQYDFTDKAPLGTVGYYRLVMTDLDGKKANSDTKVVQASLVKGFSFYPNPAVDKVHVLLAGGAVPVTITLMNQSGQVLQTITTGNNGAMVTFNVQQYPRGMYLVKVVSTAGVEQTGKLMIAH